MFISTVRGFSDIGYYLMPSYTYRCSEHLAWLGNDRNLVSLHIDICHGDEKRYWGDELDEADRKAREQFIENFVS